MKLEVLKELKHLPRQLFTEGWIIFHGEICDEEPGKSETVTRYSFG